MAAVNMDFQYFYFDIFLTETYKSLGQYEIIKNPEIIGELTTNVFSLNIPNTSTPSTPKSITVTGLTKSRLDEVKTYNVNQPFKIGINGVNTIATDYIEYTIGDVKYKTFLVDNLTIFSVTKLEDVFDNQPVIWNADSVFNDIKNTLNAMIIERGNITVYDFLNKINNSDELDDLLDIF